MLGLDGSSNLERRLRREGVFRMAGPVRNGIFGHRDRPVAPQDFQCIVDPLLRERLLQFLSAIGFTRERFEDRERVHALTQIRSGDLAGLFFNPGDVEHVVGELEGHSERAAVASRGLHDFLGSTAQPCPQTAAGGNERGRLPVDHAEVVLGRLVGAALDDLAFAQFRDGVGENPAHHRTEVGGNPARSGEQIIACENRGAVIEFSVGARHAAPDHGFVDDVVMVERCKMCELDRNCARHEARVLRVGEMPGEKNEHRPESLAAGLQQMQCRLSYQRLTRINGGAKPLFNPREIRPNIERDCLYEILSHCS